MHVKCFCGTLLKDKSKPLVGTLHTVYYDITAQLDNKICSQIRSERIL